METFEIIKQISDYGITLVLSSIVIYATIRFLKIQFDKLQTSTSRKNHDKALALRGEIDEQVYSMVNEFVEDRHFSRVQVIEFTNTVTSVAYLPFKYMSCTYEVVSYGVSSEAKIIDKLSTSLFSPFLSKLGKESKLVLDKSSSLELSGAVYDLFNQFQTEFMLCYMLKSATGKCIGYVAACKDNKVTQKDESDMTILGSKLSALLGVLDK